MSVGDTHSVEFPPRDGHEQAGRRPAIVVQSDEFFELHLLLSITDTVSSNAFAT